MFARLRFTRFGFGLSLLLAALATMVSCERGGEIASPNAGPRLSPERPSNAVLPGQYAHFYVHAFAESWTLFMGDRTPTSLATSSSVVFVVMSAGDGNKPMAYVTSREDGSRAAFDALTGVAGPWSCGTQMILTHPILRCAKGSIVAYYLRLPDGAPSGEGYGGRGSMGMLKSGAIASLTAYDGSTVYTAWDDLATTVRGIVDLESANQSAPYVEVHAPDFDRVINSGDHPDNYATADVVNANTLSRAWNLNWYQGFRTRTLAQNLTQAAHDVKQNVFYAYDMVMSSRGYGAGRFEAAEQAWLWRTYYRTATSAPPPPPEAPTALTGQVLSSARVDLTWTNNSTIATSYDVERAPDVAGVAGTYAQVASVGPTVTAYSNTGLTGSTTYWFRVRGRNGGGTSAYTNEVTVTTMLKPVAPTGLTAAAGISTRVDLAWTENATNETGYTVQRAPDVAGAPGTYATVATLGADVSSFSHTPVVGNTRYWYRVRAFNAVDQSDFSAAVSVLTPPTPPAPTAFTATVVSSTQINLTWGDTPAEISYTLERAPTVSGAAGTYVALATLPAGTTSYNDAGLTAATRYWYRLRADIATESSPWVLVNATSNPLTPLAPSNLVATVVSSTRIDLTWRDNSTTETSVQVERAPDVNGVRGTFVLIATLPADAITYSNTGLLPGARYHYRVRARNASGNSPYTSVVIATTQQPPAARVDFIVHAHPDDWELFMGDAVTAALPLTNKMVFVYTDAGDQNLGNAFWQVRETAVKVATDSLMNTAGAWSCMNETFNAHPIMRCTKENVVLYFMRLPDGGISGEGYGTRGSMNWLRDGIRPSITSFGTVTTYNSWNDLALTVRSIIAAETGTLAPAFVEVHAPEFDRTITPGDHPDHTATADLMQIAATGRSWNMNLYVNYYLQNLPINLSQAAHDIKQRLFYALDTVIAQAGYGTNRYEAEYQAWFWRTYPRRVAAP